MVSKADSEMAAERRSVARKHRTTADVRSIVRPIWPPAQIAISLQPVKIKCNGCRQYVPRVSENYCYCYYYAAFNAPFVGHKDDE